MTYTRLVKLIENGKRTGTLNKEDMLKKMDVFLLADRITDVQYKELLEMMEGND